MHTALTIAGSDSGGGAGIQADLKAFQANGVFGMSVITAITAQNTTEVRESLVLPASLVRQQLLAVFDDLPVGAVKTGMLGTAELIRTIAEVLRERRGPPMVLDPVMISKSGFPLIDDQAVGALIAELLPLATLITPNAHEAARLVGFEVNTLDEASRAAKALCELGCKAALVKGGHLDGEHATDVLFDGAASHIFQTPRIDSPHTHGTGCTLASAIAAGLARGLPLIEAVDRAKRYVHGAIVHGLPLGSGHGPTHHFWFLEGSGIFPVDDR
ncbi:MAG: bifunctional hydroxymethylpyrimidine kinase/phosphomethylpyrimidine kinase [Deltaproteobacteria bacterium]|nr:MAG: bifunctional hydroxymethylpyrimidine kinase/phosphomethylpyrimidine kinase [Deltaproteobacteria bacterium]